MSKITSLGIAFETCCSYNCPTCYQKLWNMPLSIGTDGFLKLIREATDRWNPEEVLIDYNGTAAREVLNVLSSADCVLGRKLVLTTNLKGFTSLRKNDPHIPFNSVGISVCPTSPLFMVDDSINLLKKIYSPYLHVQLTDLETYPNCTNNLSYPTPSSVYILINKFSDLWWRDPSEIAMRAYHAAEAASLKIHEIVLDNCLMTNLLGLPCPASIQMNIFPDGSMGQCPYYPFEVKDFNGCELRRMLDGNPTLTARAKERGMWL